MNEHGPFFGVDRADDQWKSIADLWLPTKNVEEVIMAGLRNSSKYTGIPSQKPIPMHPISAMRCKEFIEAMNREIEECAKRVEQQWLSEYYGVWLDASVVDSEVESECID